MRIVYLGTGEIGLPVLRWLATSGHQLVGVCTQPDRPVGRRQVMTPPCIKLEAQRLGLAVSQPVKIVADESILRKWRPDVMVVMAYGQILPQVVLQIPSVACINLHASLLPKHRGASPIQAAIRAGDACSGITVMHMAEGLDEGDVILSRAINLAPAETAGSLHDRLAQLAPDTLAEALDLLEKGHAPRCPQQEASASYAPKLGRENGRIDWSLGAVEIERMIRAYEPWPGTSTTLPPGRTHGSRERLLKVFPPVQVVPGHGEPGEVLVADAEALVVAAGDGQALALHELQPEGSRRMTTGAFLAGCRIIPGDRFGVPGKHE